MLTPALTSWFRLCPGGFHPPSRSPLTHPGLTDTRGTQQGLSFLIQQSYASLEDSRVQLQSPGHASLSPVISIYPFGHPLCLAKLHSVSLNNASLEMHAPSLPSDHTALQIHDQRKNFPWALCSRSHPMFIHSLQSWDHAWFVCELLTL